MRRVLTLLAALLALRAAAALGGGIEAGVGVVDITPTGSVVLAGSPSPVASSSVATRLQVKALVLSAGGQKAAVGSLEGGSYETWFGEHSYLTTRAVGIIVQESSDVPGRLERADHRP